MERQYKLALTIKINGNFEKNTKLKGNYITKCMWMERYTKDVVYVCDNGKFLYNYITDTRNLSERR